jgi:tRNA threonylcarbamoyladenosine biosynthesis protein TsaE
MQRTTPKNYLLSLATEADTAAFGAWLGHHLQKGDTLLLSGPIGAGKTHLARSLIRARLGDDAAEVPSPTFTLVQTYDASDVAIWHADLYRLLNSDEVIELGLDDAFETAICLVEWPEKLGSHTPEDAIRIDLDQEGDGRVAIIRFDGRPKLAAALRQHWQVHDE